MKKGFDLETANRYAKELSSQKQAIELSPELQLVAEKQARTSHEAWMKGKKSQGYVYGPDTNDDPKKGQLTNPLLVPYDELDEATKHSNIANAVAVLKILQKKNVTFVDFVKQILHPIANEIHDEWCRDKLANGWVWGPTTDKSAKIHRDLVPFHVLATHPELQGDISYDVETARSILIDMIRNCDIFPLIPDINLFQLAQVKNPY